MNTAKRFLRGEEAKNMNKEAIWEAIKQGGRLALFTGISFLVTYLLQYFGTLDQSELSVGVIIFALTMVDKYLHKSGVAEKGLSRF